MKLNIKRILNIQTLVLLIVLFSPILLYAQPDPGDDPDVPIDGGLSVLLAAGVGYGISELKRKNNEKKVK
jgi:hypothetical protein